MSIINRFLCIVTEPQFKLARDLTAMAIADGEVLSEEKEAISTICHLEGINETKLLEALKGDYDNIEEEMPKSHHEREGYMKSLIKLIGADGHAAPQEIFLFQIIASKMGLNQMNVMGLFLATATHEYFKGDAGSRVLASFLKNFIDPKGKKEVDNRDNLRFIYETVAINTDVAQDKEIDREILQQNLSRATETFLENKILMKEFADVGVDFCIMTKQVEQYVLKRYC